MQVGKKGEVDVKFVELMKVYVQVFKLWNIILGLKYYKIVDVMYKLVWYYYRNKFYDIVMYVFYYLFQMILKLIFLIVIILKMYCWCIQDSYKFLRMRLFVLNISWVVCCKIRVIQKRVVSQFVRQKVFGRRLYCLKIGSLQQVKRILMILCSFGCDDCDVKVFCCVYEVR